MKIDVLELVKFSYTYKGLNYIHMLREDEIVEVYDPTTNDE